jgi:phosphonate transport system substrate-binding protein
MTTYFRTTLLAAALVGAALTAQAQAVLRVTAIPDESPTELARKFEPLGKYLEARLGMKIEWTPVTDYAAAVETLVNSSRMRRRASRSWKTSRAGR